MMMMAHRDKVESVKLVRKAEINSGLQSSVRG